MSESAESPEPETGGLPNNRVNASSAEAPASAPVPEARLREYAACALCGSMSHRHWWSGHGPAGDEVFQIVRCRSCGLVFLNPRDVDRNRRQQTARSPRYGEWPPFEQRARRAMFIEWQRRVGPHALGRTLLDFGCGARAWFWKEAMAHGWDAYACDIKRANIERLQELHGRERFFTFAAGDLGAAHDDRFDVANASEVLEHVPEPRVTLGELRRVLKHDGALTLDVPNVNMALARLVRGRAANPPAHAYYWSPETLHRFLEGGGFTVVVLQSGLGGLRRLSRVMEPAAAAACASRLRRFTSLGGGIFAVAVKTAH